MKYPVFLLLLVFSFAAQAQQLKVNMYDRFIKKRVIETTKVSLKQEKNDGMMVSMSAVGDSLTMLVEGYGEGAITIRAKDEMIFLLSNDSTVVAHSVSAQPFNFDDHNRHTYEHEYQLTPHALKMLGRHDLMAIRKYGVKGYVDITIPANKRGELRKACQLLFNELVKEKQL